MSDVQVKWGAAEQERAGGGKHDMSKQVRQHPIDVREQSWDTRRTCRPFRLRDFGFLSFPLGLSVLSFSVLSLLSRALLSERPRMSPNVSFPMPNATGGGVEVRAGTIELIGREA